MNSDKFNLVDSVEISTIKGLFDPHYKPEFNTYTKKMLLMSLIEEKSQLSFKTG